MINKINMKQVKKIIALCVAVIGFTSVQAQDAKNPWTLSFGINSVSLMPNSDASPKGFSDSFSAYYKVKDQWNVLPSVSYFNVSRHIKGGFSAGITGTVNKITKIREYSVSAGQCAQL